MFTSFKNMTFAFVALIGFSGFAQANVIMNTSGDLRFSDPRDLQGKHFHMHSLFLEAGRNYVFEMNSPHFDTFLKLTKGGLLVRQNDDGGPALNSKINFTPTVSGTYQLAATSFSPNATGSYQLRAFRLGGYVLQTSGDLDFNDPTVNGKHQKVFSVSLRAGRQYTINMHSVHFDTFLKLKKNGLVIRQNDDGGPGRDSRITITPSVSGQFVIVATSCTNGATGHFTLNVRD